MTTINLQLPEKLEKHLIYLETISKRPKDFIVKEALIQFLEHAEDLADLFNCKVKEGEKFYTTEELLENLNLKNV